MAKQDDTKQMPAPHDAIYAPVTKREAEPENEFGEPLDEERACQPGHSGHKGR